MIVTTAGDTMGIDELNALPPDRAATLVRPCVDIDRWVEDLVEGRPYDDLAHLLVTARAAAATWTPDEVEAALAGHPRIGERPTGADPGAALSRREQAGVDPRDADLAARLADGNRRYEERFGRIYLVRAAGRSAQEMLDLLERRLGNDPVTELDVTSAQLTEIALLRLEGLFA